MEASLPNPGDDPYTPLAECERDRECGPTMECVDGRCRDATGEDPTGGPSFGIDLTRTDPYTSPVRGRLSGRVWDLAGGGLAGASVALESGGAATTDARGRWTIDGVAPGTHLVHFTRAGYLSVHRMVELDGWSRLSLDVSLKQAAPPQPFDASAGATLRTGNVVVTVPPGGFVDDRGMPVAGGAEAHVTPIDPTTADIEASPGAFLGEESDRSVAPLISFGMADISFTQAGTPLQLAPGAIARIEMPLPIMGPTDPVVRGDTIPLWWFDPARATWVRDGTATAILASDGSGRTVFAADVTHFTPWNCDRPAIPICVQGRVVDCAGFPIAGAEIRLTGPSVTSLATGLTDADGRYTVSGAARGEAIVEARISIGSGFFTVDTGPFSVTTSACTEAPELALEDLRYASGSIDISRSRPLGQAAETFGTAVFWDVDAADDPPIAGCAPPPIDDDLTLVTLPPDAPTGGGEEVAVVDVGNPIDLANAGVVVSLYRNRSPDAEGEPVQGPYVSLPDMEIATGSQQLDVEIPGAAGSVPHTVHTGALHVPEELVVMSPTPDALVEFDPAAGLPIRWEPPADADGPLSIAIIQMTGEKKVLFGHVEDDGEFDVTADQLAGLEGRALVVLSRATERFEPLPTGPSVTLRGSTGVSFQLDLPE